MKTAACIPLVVIRPPNARRNEIGQSVPASDINPASECRKKRNRAICPGLRYQSGLRMLKEAKSSIPHSKVNPVFERLRTPWFYCGYMARQLAVGKRRLFFQEPFSV